MPDLIDHVALLGDDPGDDDAHEDEPTKPARTPRVTTPKVDTRLAVDRVLALMGRSGTPAAGAAPKNQQVLPSARARAAVERLVQYGTVENLEAARVDVKALCRDLFDWGSPAGQTRATKPVLKAVGTALLARDGSGRSLYPQAVEMLSFASAAAPLLQPDRLGRLIETAPTVETAFAPERYTMQLASALKTLLTRYPDQRREQLLTSMWRQAHDGRWWDMTSGVIVVRTGTRRRQDRDVAERQAADQVLREILVGAQEGTPAAHAAVTDAFAQGHLPFNVATRRLMQALPETPQLHQLLGDLAARMRAGRGIDPDLALHASHLHWLLPAELPETPLTWLVKTLVSAITPDPDTGVVEVEALPDKPKEFSDLFPLAELRGFPFPNAVRALDRTALPGTVAGDVLIELVSNPSELADNRDYMGNCTWSYKNSMEQGSYVLLKLWRGQDCYNAALRHDPVAWSLGEINSRFNRGGVPEDIRQGVVRLAAQLPSPGPLHTPEAGERREKRQVRYAV